MEPLLGEGVAGIAAQAPEAQEAPAGGALTMQLYRPLEAPAGALRFKIYRAGQPIALSRSLPMLEHLGVRVNEERPYCIEPVDAAPIWMHDFGMVTVDGSDVDLDDVRVRFEDAFARIWTGEVENDALNRLVLEAGLTWREVRILRAYARYIRQIGSTFSNAYMESALTGNRSIARALVHLFLVRFDPAAGDAERTRRSDTLRAQIAEALEDVPNLDEDRILRQFLGVLEATVRTNYFQSGAQGGQSSRICRSSSIRRAYRACPSPSRCSRSGSIHRVSRVCTCAEAGSRAAGCAGPTGAKISVPRCSDWSRRRW